MRKVVYEASEPLPALKRAVNSTASGTHTDLIESPWMMRAGRCLCPIMGCSSLKTEFVSKLPARSPLAEACIVCFASQSPANIAILSTIRKSRIELTVSICLMKIWWKGPWQGPGWRPAPQNEQDRSEIAAHSHDEVGTVARLKLRGYHHR